MSKNVREQSVDVLIKIEKEESYAQLVVKEALQSVESIDKGFMTELVYGTLKYQIQIDYILNQYSKTPVKKMKPLIRNVLRASVYQLFYMDKVPASAVINEAVKLVKKRKFVPLSGFVNGLLRTVDRERKNIKYPDPNSDLVGYLSIVYALPTWILEEWLGHYTPNEVEEMCQALNKRASVCLRTNVLKTTANELKAKLEAEGVKVLPGHLLDEAFYIKEVNNLQALPSFKEGLWTVQDESAMLVAHVVAPKPGERILDMCAAPGGKSTHLAELMGNQGEVISCDVHPHKLELIEKNAKRLGTSIVKPLLQNGRTLNEAFVEGFDKVLLDAPCSGLGILKRKPDMRSRKEPEDIEAIVKIQEDLIKQAICYLKTGGRLVYSTCTISYRENEGMVRKLLENQGLELEKVVDTIPKPLKSEIKKEGMLQILPHMADTDGFFIASFRKKES